MKVSEILNREAKVWGIELDDTALEAFDLYAHRLQEANKVMNLTAVDDDEGIAKRHFLDSLRPLALGWIDEGARLVDVGTGAGFPGLPLALACPNLKVTLMDAQQKRLNFLQAVIDDLNVRNVTLVHARAEDGAQFPNHREKYDIAVARAVASLAVLSEYLLPYVRVGGKMLCWKGPALMDELPQGRKAAFLLGGKVGEPIPVTFPGRDWQHMLLPVQKAAKTARQYPRKAGTPGKSPLGGNDKK